MRYECSAFLTLCGTSNFKTIFIENQKCIECEEMFPNQNDKTQPTPAAAVGDNDDDDKLIIKPL